MGDVEAALEAAWNGESLTPYAALVLVRRIETLTRECDELRETAAEVEPLRRRLAAARATIAEQRTVIGRAGAIYNRTADVHVGIAARRAAQWILEG